MSKVVHLSEKAHAKAKAFCKENGLRMSDWVASLINEAVNRGRHRPPVRTAVPKKKLITHLDEGEQDTNDEGVPAYSMPPFWDRDVPRSSQSN